MKFNFLLIIILVSCTYAECGRKRLECRTPKYQFEAPLKIIPDTDSIKVGDTILFKIETSSLLKDLETNQLIDYSNASDFRTYISFIELTGGDISNPGANDAANDFDIVLVSGTRLNRYDTDRTRNFQFAENNAIYKLEAGLIPNKKGVFAIATAEVGGVKRQNDPCTKATFSFRFTDTDQHLYLYEQSRPGYEPSGYERKHMYFFKVY